MGATRDDANEVPIPRAPGVGLDGVRKIPGEFPLTARDAHNAHRRSLRDRGIISNNVRSGLLSPRGKRRPRRTTRRHRHTWPHKSGVFVWTRLFVKPRKERVGREMASRLAIVR